MDQNEQDFSNDNQHYSIYGDDTHEQNSLNKFKRINDYIENHYHDSNSDDVDMDGNNIGRISKYYFINYLTLYCVLGYSKSLENMNDSDDMDVDVSPMSSKSIKSGIERMLELGRELLQMSLRLEKKYSIGSDEIVAQNRKMMEVSGCGWVVKNLDNVRYLDYIELNFKFIFN